METIIGEAARQAGRSLAVVNPATKEIIDTVSLASEEDVDDAIRLAQEGRMAWGKMPSAARYETLRRFSDAVSDQREPLARLLCQETGKPLEQAGWEIDTAIRLFIGYAERAKFTHGEAIPLDNQRGLEGDLLFTIREPLGVVAAITPFNFPIDLFAHKVAPALAAGNSVIVKPDPRTPLTTALMVRLLIEAGVPGTAVQCVHGGAEIGRILATAPGIDAISLTGSAGAGREVASIGGRALKRVFLELSGNDPLLVYPDADVKAAVDAVVFGRLLANGQTCCATKRIMVHDSLADAFVSALQVELEQVRIGDPMKPEINLGPLIDGQAAARLQVQVQSLLAQGAEAVVPGERYDDNFFSPALLVNMPMDSEAVATEETFGPVFVVQRFQTDTEAIAAANRSPYALNAAVFTSDIERAFRLADQIDAGSVMINATTLYRPDVMAFGGYKQSGFGREGLLYTLEEMTRVKSIVVHGALASRRRSAVLGL